MSELVFSLVSFFTLGIVVLNYTKKDGLQCNSFSTCILFTFHCDINWVFVTKKTLSPLPKPQGHKYLPSKK